MSSFTPSNFNYIPLSSSQQETLIDGACSRAQVSGLTHTYYKYPARFSPEFARSVIETFSEPGDTVLDPFMGGGTTLIESYAAGRVAVGTDISTLAEFVSQVKTTVLSARQIKELMIWFSQLSSKLNVNGYVERPEEWINRGYQKNLGSKNVWRIRKLIEQALNYCDELGDDEQLRFARCAILKTAQWALDGRKQIPSSSAFRETLENNFEMMLEGHTHLQANLQPKQKKPICLNISADEISSHKVWKTIKKPKLILTSPPYPGVHMLYHRWQVDGRKETPAPFWIANKLDGAGLSYYTMGDRKQHELKTYYEKAETIFSNLKKISLPNTTVVQMIAFTEPEWQLPKYLDMMSRCGFKEKFLSNLSSKDSRIWRDVPNRKWHANLKGATHSSKEVVLFHKTAN